MTLLSPVIALARRSRATVWLPWLLACAGWLAAERYVPVPDDQDGSFGGLLAGVDWGTMLVLALIPPSDTLGIPFASGWFLKLISLGLVLVSATSALAGALPGHTFVLVHVRHTIEPVAIAPLGAIVGLVIGLMARDVFAAKPREANPPALLDQIEVSAPRNAARKASMAGDQETCEKLHEGIVKQATDQLRAELARDLPPVAPKPSVPAP